MAEEIFMEKTKNDKELFFATGYLLILILLMLSLIGYFLFFSNSRKTPDVAINNIGTKDQDSGDIQNIENLVLKTSQEAIEKLNTPQKLISFLNKNFTIQERDGYKAYDPDEFLLQKKGSSHDLAVFCAYILSKNEYEAGVIRFNYLSEDGEKESRSVTVFRDVDLPKYITVTNEGIKMFHYGWSFEDLCLAEEKRLNIQIFEYVFFPAGIFDLTDPLKGYQWRKRP